MRPAMLVLSTLTTGLVGGLLYGWMVSVIPGLRRIADDNYLSTMQSINRQIINPGFLIPFIGTPFILVLASIVHFRAGQTRRGWLLASAAVTYVVGVGAVTAVGNIPRNITLDTFDTATATCAAKTAMRSGYEGSWNAWHAARAAASVLALSLAAAAAVVADEAD